MDFKNNVPFIKKGLEVSQISFTGGRTAASLANHGGITHIDYYGAQRFGDVQLYKGDQISAWSQVFRPCVAINGDLYYLEFNDTLIYPFGYSSQCRVGGIRFAHGMWLLNDAIVFTATILDKTVKARVSFKLLQAQAYCVKKPTRTWRQFTLDGTSGAALASVTDAYSDEMIKKEIAAAEAKAAEALIHVKSDFGPQTAHSETWLGVVSSSVLKMRETPKSFRKFYFEADFRKGRSALTLAFGHSGRAGFLERLGQLQSGAIREASQLVKQYEARLASQPKISIGRKSIQSLFANAAPILDSMKVKDVPGAMRAADSGYWVWGWDSMVYPEALGFVSDANFMVEMLDFYRRTADPDAGIIHAMKIDQRPHLAMEFSAQCIYTVLLYHAYVFTGDVKLLSDYLPFARAIMQKAAESELGDTGLTTGLSLYPDAPEDLEQDGNDISVFNNSIYYQALKAMAALSTEAGDTEEAARYTEKAGRTRAGFDKLYDSEKGYFFDSISSKNFSPRRHYPNYAILWITPFAADLVEGRVGPIAKFMKANFPARHGLRMFPKWDSRFMYDGCQLGMSMAVVESFHREMMKLDHDAKGVGAMFENMEWFWDQLCVPEALTCECENHGITVDNPGRKQAFCAKAWLSMFYHVAAGINLTTEGLAFTACDSEDIAISDLSIRGKKLDLKISGRGWKIGSLTLNGKPVPGPYTIPFSSLKKRNKIVVKRKR
jgi:hypothetical protein